MIKAMVLLVPQMLVNGVAKEVEWPESCCEGTDMRIQIAELVNQEVESDHSML